MSFTPSCERFVSVVDGSHFTVNWPRSRMSFDDAPIMMRKTPGSTTHLMSSVEHPQVIRAEREADVALFAGLQVGDAREAFSSMTGRATDASTSRM